MSVSFFENYSNDDDRNINRVICDLVMKELEFAETKYPSINSAWEGYAILKEEVEETNEEFIIVKEMLERLWKEIRAKSDSNTDTDASHSNTAFISLFNKQEIILNKMTLHVYFTIKELIQVMAMVMRYKKNVLKNMEGTT